MAAVGVRIGQDAELDSGAARLRGGGSSSGSGGVKVNAMERKWSRDRESYLTDNGDPLPLPMTYPNTSPVSPEEIDRRLRCDPIVEVRIANSVLIWVLFVKLYVDKSFKNLESFGKFCRIARKLYMNGQESVGVAKAQDLSVITTKEEEKLSANAYLAKELVCCSVLLSFLSSFWALSIRSLEKMGLVYLAWFNSAIC